MIKEKNPFDWYQIFAAFEKVYGVENPMKKGQNFEEYFLLNGDPFDVYYRKKGVQAEAMGFSDALSGRPDVCQELSLIDKARMFFNREMGDRVTKYREGYQKGLEKRVTASRV